MARRRAAVAYQRYSDAQQAYCQNPGPDTGRALVLARFIWQRAYTLAEDMGPDRDYDYSAHTRPDPAARADEINVDKVPAQLALPI